MLYETTTRSPCTVATFKYLAPLTLNNFLYYKTFVGIQCSEMSRKEQDGLVSNQKATVEHFGKSQIISYLKRSLFAYKFKSLLESL